MITFHAKVAQGWEVISSDTLMQFPAGEQHIVDKAVSGEAPKYLVVRGTDMNEYAAAAMWIDLQHRKGFEVTAVIPYLPGARADRGQPLGARVYANLINAMQADRVIAFDVHSPVMAGMVDRLQVVDPAHAVRRTVCTRMGDTSFAGVIAPDAGAVDRASRAAAGMHLPLFKAEKHRDFRTGKLSGFSCEPLPARGRLLVVDDICDGGGTFMGLAEATGLSRDRLALWVSHGIFSGRAGQLTSAYGQIFTTDSHPGHTNPDVHAHVTSVIGHIALETQL